MNYLKGTIVCGVSAAAIWVGSYVANSSFGMYNAPLTPDMSMATGPAVWNPRYGFVMKENIDAFGVIYFPLIKLDRKFIHPTKQFNSNGTWTFTS